MNRVAAYSVLATTILLALGQLAWQLPQLPAEVATHFGAAGQPDGFMSKLGYMCMMLGLSIGTPTFLIGVTYLTRIMPIELINIPNREYWFHEDRRDASMRHMEIILIWIAIATQLLFLGINWLTFQANVKQTALDTTTAAVLLVSYLIAIFGCCGWTFWRFRRPPILES